ncbi:hypothetical protein ST47_g634 [Ascochyta rabiei]|uniref:SnoaL-like domain-containing protein n=2 Tax=Didymella rabiei TaxID=5454 RepID=A0A163LYU5_DIDRA|nr:hypothetical protein ST47_g634 [Ascochyta rabiei]
MTSTPPQARLADVATATTLHTSRKHTALHCTALAFVHAQRHNASLDTRMDFAALRSLAAPHFSHTFGPAYAVSCAPKLQGAFTLDGLLAHLGAMVPLLEGWEVEVTGCVVDEVGERVVVRASYYMRVRGARETVENEVVWWLELEESLPGSAIGKEEVGGGWRVTRSTEMVDAGAAGRIRELMAGNKGEEVVRRDSALVAA